MARPSYEQSSESGRERHLNIPYSRLEDGTPTLHDPACVIGLPTGTQITGTIIDLSATDLEVVLNHARGAVYRHYVRNVATYDLTIALHEETWRVINVGDAVYYDEESDFLNGVKLSFAPLESDAATPNPLFGWVCLLQDETYADFYKGIGSSGSTHLVAVVQA